MTIVLLPIIIITIIIIAIVNIHLFSNMHVFPLDSTDHRLPCSSPHPQNIVQCMVVNI